jgi:hypothetical protein
MALGEVEGWADEGRGLRYARARKAYAVGQA